VQVSVFKCVVSALNIPFCELIVVVQVGGVFVDRAAKEVLKEKLGNSPFAEEDYLKDMLATFEKKVIIYLFYCPLDLLIWSNRQSACLTALRPLISWILVDLVITIRPMASSKEN
jgi:hypothetical protein